jgi:hypothetical protein
VSFKFKIGVLEFKQGYLICLKNVYSLSVFIDRFIFAKIIQLKWKKLEIL